MALRFAGLGSFVERSATKAAIAQASLSAARRGARSNVDHIAPEIAAAYTLGMTRTRVVFRCDQNIMRAMRRGRAGAGIENFHKSVYYLFESSSLDSPALKWLTQEADAKNWSSPKHVQPEEGRNKPAPRAIKFRKSRVETTI